MVVESTHIEDWSKYCCYFFWSRFTVLVITIHDIMTMAGTIDSMFILM